MQALLILDPPKKERPLLPEPSRPSWFTLLLSRKTRDAWIQHKEATELLNTVNPILEANRVRKILTPDKLVIYYNKLLLVVEEGIQGPHQVLSEIEISDDLIECALLYKEAHEKFRKKVSESGAITYRRPFFSLQMGVGVYVWSKELTYLFSYQCSVQKVLFERYGLILHSLGMLSLSDIKNPF